MNAVLNEKAEQIKRNIKGSAEKSKETIRQFIDSNKKNVGEAIDSNKKIVDSIKEKLDQEEDVSDSVTENVKDTFGKSVELAEDAIDSIINSFTKQMEMDIDFNTKLVDVIKETNNGNTEKMLELVQQNFEASNQLAINNTKEMLDFYNKHTNLAVNFNKKFGETINSQIETLFKIQGKGLNKFAEWATEWWKDEGKK